MKPYLQRAENVLSRINELSLISDDQYGITRTFGSPAFIQGSICVQSWMREAGLKTRIDNIGNIRGRLECGNPVAKTFVIASHIDTVINAGKFDGPLGVTMGLNILENLAEENTSLSFNIELIAFSDEEGVRFHTTFLGSKAVAGSFDKQLLKKKDEYGIELTDVIKQMGGDADILDRDRLPLQDWLGYFEMHIEQGPVLYDRNIPVAIVSSIAGQKRFEISFEGAAGHAGTVPMDMRSDALCCAAECIIEIEKFALANKDAIVATVGKLNILHAASNVIPGEVVCTLDCRSADERVLTYSVKNMREICEQVSRRRGVSCGWELVQETTPVDCDDDMNNLLAQSIKASGFECLSLVSGAGHDAVPVSSIAPVCMLFVRCFKGISHNPLEDVEIKDIAAALQVADKFIEQLIKANNL